VAVAAGGARQRAVVVGGDDPGRQPAHLRVHRPGGAGHVQPTRGTEPAPGQYAPAADDRGRVRSRRHRRRDGPSGHAGDDAARRRKPDRGERMNGDADPVMSWIPLAILQTSLLPGLVIFTLAERQVRLRSALNLFGALSKVGLVIALIPPVASGLRLEWRQPLLPGIDLVFITDP